jgi:hypothetical protein
MEILMNKRNNLSLPILALSILAISGLANAEGTNVFIKSISARPFTPSVQPLAAAINAYKAAVTPEEKLIAQQKLLATVAAEILNDPSNAALITSEAVAAAPDLAGPITLAAKEAAPQMSNAIITAALTVPGVNPTDVTAPTAAGPNSDRGESNRGDSNRGDFNRSSSTPSGSGGGGHGRTASPS